MRRSLSVAVFLGFLVAGTTACGDDGPARDGEGAIAEEGDLGVESVGVGDCFDDPGDVDLTEERAELSSVAAVPCDRPHDNEVFHIFDLPDGDYPGDTEVEEQAFVGCAEQFDAYVGATYEESELEIFPLTPTESSWNDADDREVICAVYIPGGEPLTGTARGSGR